MLTWVIVVIEGDWRLLGIFNRKSAEELNNNYTVSVWHLEGEGGRKGGGGGGRDHLMGTYKGGSEYYY